MTRPAKTKGGIAHMMRVKALSCCTCGGGGSEAHHIRDQGVRAGDWVTIPLCPSCHRFSQGVHGDKTMLRISRKTEWQHLNDTLEALYGG